MKSTFRLFIFFISVLYSSQQANIFEKVSHENSNISKKPENIYKNDEVKKESQDPMETNFVGPNPADPVPIDNYIPILVITAMALIIFNQRSYRQS